MTPNFALGLTELGITLWQRDKAGWLRVGAVPMDAPDLDVQMQGLVAKAHALAPDGIVTKLVIPDDQILYTHLPVAQDDAAIRAALHGKTPYPVEELDFDWIPQGDGVLAAVVARETLIEAEDLASSQGLNPVCFVAAPEARGFAQEPFFKTARGVRLDPAELGRGGPILRETGIVAANQDTASTADEISEPTRTASEASNTTENAVEAPSKSASLTESAASPTPQAPSTPTPAEPLLVKPAVKDASATIETNKTDVAPKVADTSVSFRSRRAAPVPSGPTSASSHSHDQMPSASALGNPAPPSKTLKALSKARGLSLGSIGGAALAAKLRASIAAPVVKAGSGLRNATDQLGRKIAPNPAKDAPKVDAPVARSEPTSQAKSAPNAARRQPASAPAQRPVAKPSMGAPKVASKTVGAAAEKPRSNNEAERLTVFGARRGGAVVEPSLPKRALLISGAALMLVLAVAIWAFYFSRAPIEDLAQPVLPAETTTEVAAPDPLSLPDPAPEESEQIEAALGATDTAQAQGSAPETGAEPSEGTVAAEIAQPEVASPQADAGRLAALRSVRAIAPDSPGNLPAIQAPPAPFASTALPPLREEAGQAVAPVEDEATVLAEPAPVQPTPDQPSLPAGEEALEIEVTQGRPAVVPPARPAGIAPEPEAAIEPEVIPEAIADAVSEAQTAPEDPLDPLDESDLVIDVTEGAPAITPPDRPEGIAPEPVLDTPNEVAPDATDDAVNESASDPDQASLTPPPGGVALTFIAPAPRPTVIAEQAAVQAEQFASATPQAVAASLRPSNRPNGFSQTVQRALAAARIRQVAPPAPEAQIVQASAASVAPRIPSSATVSSAATQTRAINLRQINLLGVMGTPTARRALVRLDNGRVVTVQVGERLDGGQVTAIGDSELRYNKRGRDVVLRIAS